VTLASASRWSARSDRFLSFRLRDLTRENIHAIFAQHPLHFTDCAPTVILCSADTMREARCVQVYYF
jgi:hypothetical protein